MINTILNHFSNDAFVYIIDIKDDNQNINNIRDQYYRKSKIV